MGGGGGGQTQTNTIQKSDPWAGQQPYLLDLFKRAMAQVNQPAYPGTMVAAPSEATKQGQNLALGAVPQLQNVATSAIDASNWNLGPASRDMSTNTYLQDAIKAAQRPVLDAFSAPGGPMSSIRSSFNAGNSGGSSTRQGIAEGIALKGLGQTLSDQASNMTWAGYTNAQDQALKTLALLPQTQGMLSLPAATASGVGAQQDAYTQALINAEMQKYNYPWQALGGYSGLIQGNYGGSSNSTVTAPAPTTSPFLGAAGGAMMGGSLASSMPWLGLSGPWGAGIGGLIGLLGSR